MNNTLKRIFDIEDESLRFYYLDLLLEKKLIDIDMIKTYYLGTNNIDKIIAFTNYYLYDYKDIVLIEDYVINNLPSFASVRFAEMVEASNKNKLEDRVVVSSVPTAIYYFAKIVPNANIERLEEAIIKSWDKTCIELFRDGVPLANKNKLNNALNEIEKVEKCFSAFSNKKKIKVINYKRKEGDE